MEAITTNKFPLALASVQGSGYHKEYVARFRNRQHAGEELGRALEAFHGRDDVVVLALPRGGIPVARAVAQALDAPLDILVARKIGHPLAEEYAIAAITEHGTLLKNTDETSALPNTWFETSVAREEAEAHRRRATYTPGHKLPALRDKIVILVDDGMATGLTMRAAIADARAQGAQRVVVATPVAPVTTALLLFREANDFFCLLLTSGWFPGVGAYYNDFPQLSDTEVIAELQSSQNNKAPVQQ